MLNITHRFVNFYSTVNLFLRQMYQLTWGSGKNFKLPKPQVNSPENLISKCSVEYKFPSHIFMSTKLSKVQLTESWIISLADIQYSIKVGYGGVKQGWTAVSLNEFFRVRELTVLLKNPKYHAIIPLSILQRNR
jgi:hypothetical protein